MINHLSVSQVKLYLLCPLKYFYRYIQRLPAPPPSEVTLGHSFHTALETNFRQKITSQQDLPLTHVTDAFSDAWDTEAKETLFEEGEKPGEIKDEGITILGVYHPTTCLRPVGSLSDVGEPPLAGETDGGAIPPSPPPSSPKRWSSPSSSPSPPHQVAASD